MKKFEAVNRACRGQIARPVIAKDPLEAQHMDARGKNDLRVRGRQDRDLGEVEG